MGFEIISGVEILRTVINANQGHPDPVDIAGMKISEEECLNPITAG
jgi:hypothetical protein